MATLVAADAWAGTASGYHSLFAARMFSGVGQGAFECLALSNVPDLYFAHQRSKRIALFWIMLQTGVYLGVPVGTQIINKSGWHIAFTALSITDGITLVLLFLFYHEPAYRRAHIDPLANMSETAVLEKVHEAEVEEVPGQTDLEHGPPSNAAIEKPKTFVQNLKLYNGQFSHNNIFVLLYRSLILTSILLSSGLQRPVGCSFTIAAFMTAPPYHMSSDAIGNMYKAPWLGGLIALVVADPNFSRLTNYLTKRNNSVYEPEFSLFATIPGISLFVIGTVEWGWGSQVGSPRGGIVVFFGLMLGGAMVYNAGMIGYIIDAHREWANESQVIFFVAKNIFPFGMGYFFVPWWEGADGKTVWGIVARVAGGLALPGIPVYIYGKKMRAFWSRHHFMWISEIKHQTTVIA